MVRTLSLVILFGRSERQMIAVGIHAFAIIRLPRVWLTKMPEFASTLARRFLTILEMIYSWSLHIWAANVS